MIVDEDADVDEIGDLSNRGLEVFSALYAGMTTDMRLPLIIEEVR